VREIITQEVSLVIKNKLSGKIVCPNFGHLWVPRFRWIHLPNATTVYLIHR
ncbi:uncharacterized protein METZ01_LOCUS312967, partial [marine metagenome]